MTADTTNQRSLRVDIWRNTTVIYNLCAGCGTRLKDEDEVLTLDLCTGQIDWHEACLFRLPETLVGAIRELADRDANRAEDAVQAGRRALDAADAAQRAIGPPGRDEVRT